MARFVAWILMMASCSYFHVTTTGSSSMAITYHFQALEVLLVWKPPTVNESGNNHKVRKPVDDVASEVDQGSVGNFTAYIDY